MKNVLKLLVVAWMIFVGYASAGVKELEAEYNSLQSEYVDFKANSILERDKIDKEIKLLDDQIAQLYNSKNITQQELFVLKDAKDALAGKVDTSKGQVQAFNERVIDLLDTEKKKTKSLFPYLVESSILRLKEVEDTTKSSFINSALLLLQYRHFLIQEASMIRIIDSEIINPRNESIKVKELRLGFIHDSYISEDGKEIAFLLNKMTLSGPIYFWKDTTGKLNTNLNQLILSVYNADKPTEFFIPIDIGNGGEKLPYFLEQDGSKRNSIFTSVINFFNDGGVLMYPLLFTGIIALYIIFERVTFYRRNRIRLDQKTVEDIIHSMSSGDKEKAKKLCQTNSNMVTRILVKMLDEKTRKNAEALAEEGFMEEIPKLDRRLSTLSMLAAISPLMGLLGTVVGMITLFNVITTYGSNNPKILAGGISVALITTQAGLMLAVPIIVVHHVLVRIKNAMIIRTEIVTSHFINKIFPS